LPALYKGNYYILLNSGSFGFANKNYSLAIDTIISNFTPSSISNYGGVLTFNGFALPKNPKVINNGGYDC